MGLGYGVSSQKEIIAHIRRVAQAFSPATAPQAVDMMIGTACAETGLGSTRDNLRGEGKGLFQFDHIGFIDAYERGIVVKPKIQKLLHDEFCINWQWLAFDQLDFSPLVSSVMCRIKYMLVPESLPQVGDLDAQAGYWKKHWNTELGKGTTEHYIKAYRANYLGHNI